MADRARSGGGAGGRAAAPAEGRLDPALGQAAYDLRFDWGRDGLDAVGAGASVVVIVDVLRFSTAVSVAVGRGAAVLPYAWEIGDAAAAYARDQAAELAGRREDGGWALSPAELLDLAAGSRLVLPSPAGSALAFGAGGAGGAATVLAGCLRNAGAVAGAAAAHDGPVAVVAAAERWHGDLGPARPAVEDLVGAGAVLAAVAERRRAAGAGAAVSPEASAAIAAFAAVRDDLAGWLPATASGRALVARGGTADVATAAMLDADHAAPVLQGTAFVAAPTSP